ncbi:hypothetical protein ACN6A1_01390 [Myxococcus virescens]|uniref:hypothetical protein n=1 Tax=Myxococcus virescens TaxID=83456 RepID=UPI003DA57268
MRIASFLSIFPQWLILSLSLLGTQAFAQYVPGPDGVILLGIGTANRYLVAGGARFFIPPAQHSLFPGTLVALDQSTIDSYTQIPRDGTLFRQYGTSATYVMAGQMHWLIPSLEELDHWDDWKTIHVIPNSNWGDPIYFFNYSNTILVRERSTSQIYLWIAGAKFPLTDPADIAYYGGSTNVKTIPLGSMAGMTSEPWCGTVLRERSSTTAYALGYHLGDNPLIMRKAVTTAPAGGVVPDGVLSSYPPIPGVACIW